MILYNNFNTSETFHKIYNTQNCYGCQACLYCDAVFILVVSVKEKWSQYQSPRERVYSDLHFNARYFSDQFLKEKRIIYIITKLNSAKKNFFRFVRSATVSIRVLNTPTDIIVDVLGRISWIWSLICWLELNFTC